MAKKYGNIYFLGVGMLINSVFAFLVPVAAEWGVGWLIAVRFIQGLGEVSKHYKLYEVRHSIFVTFFFIFYNFAFTFTSSYSNNILCEFVNKNASKCLTFVPCIGTEP